MGTACLSPNSLRAFSKDYQGKSQTRLLLINSYWKMKLLRFSCRNEQQKRDALFSIPLLSNRIDTKLFLESPPQ
jgi:hypothetical protein